MTVKLILLKSGEDVICDISEMVVGEGENERVVGYYLDKPCLVKMRDPAPVDSPTPIVKLSENAKQTGFQVSLFPWMPLSKNRVIPIVAEWLVTMTDPIDRLVELYNEAQLKDDEDPSPDK